MKAIARLVFALLAGGWTEAFAQSPAVTAADFAATAEAALPVERPYAFHARLSDWADPLRRDPSARPAPSEVAVANRGWTIRIAPTAGIVLRTAAQEFQQYLDRSMRVTAAIEETAPGVISAPAPRSITLATREQLPELGARLGAAKDYRLVVAENAVQICGYDEAGAMYGVYNLEERMNLREAPFLAPVDSVRRSLYKTRITLSGLGWDEWPDRYLALLSRYGIDSIYASVYANPNGVGGPPPHWDRMKKQDPAKIHDLVRRAGRYGIHVYCPIVYLYTGEPDNEAGLRKLVRDLVTEFPEIRGYVLLTEGFFYKVFFGAGGQSGVDLRDWVRHWDHGVAIVTEEAHRANPAIEILPWEYNIDFRPERAELKRYGTSQLPLDCIPLLTFENGKSFSRDGEIGSLKDYAINETGPAEVTAAQIDEAKRRGMRGVYVKADTWASWMFGTFPYVPVPYQWYARYQALEKAGVDGALESWSYGFKPNFVAEMRAWYCWSDAPPLDELLRSMARQKFGAGQEDQVLRAWKQFSQAIRLLPDTGPLMGTNTAVGLPLFFEKPEPKTLTLEHSWSDPTAWAVASMVNPVWPYTHKRVVFTPDFTDRTDAAANYARPFSLAVFEKYEKLAADGLEAGLRDYRAAALTAPAAKRAAAFQEVLLVEQMQRMLRSTLAILQFESLRLELHRTPERSRSAAILDSMTQLLQEEQTRTRASLATARRDSRLGYEWEQDYLCSTAMIGEKLQQLELTLNELIPAYRREHGI